MKQIYIFLLTILTAFGANAQKDVYLKIDHLLNGQPFAFSATGTNNLGNQFKVNRLQYYISEVNIIHDGGMVTPAATEYFLVDGQAGLNAMLGNFNITTIEGVQLGIGHERRFEPAVIALREEIAKGTIGTVLQIEANFSQDKFFALPPDNWRLSNRFAPVGPLTATGIHLVDLAVAILGPSEAVWARLATRGSQFENGDTLGIMMAFPSNNVKENDQAASSSFYGSFTSGLITNIFNIKAFIFFVSLFSILTYSMDLLFFYIFPIYFSITSALWFMFLSYLLSSSNTFNIERNNLINKLMALILCSIGLFIFIKSIYEYF